MNKRDAVLSILDADGTQSYVPAAFFLHFDRQFHRGQPAIDKHMDYFRQTDMDFVKIQFEHPFPHVPAIKRPADWASMPLYDEAFFAEPLAVVDGLVKAAKKDALVLMTLYSPFMCAGQAVTNDVLMQHLIEDADKVKPGLEIVAESLIAFVRGCVQRGVDGFYMSTQGGEAGRFEDPTIFERTIKPTDLMLMQEIDRTCPFSILHVCDYHLGYDDLTPFLDYPGQVVNCAQQVGGRELSMQELAKLFDRPFMGGMDRHGAIAKGDAEAVVTQVQKLLEQAPDRYILGADCTIPGDTDWRTIRQAIDTAHGL
jgi:uroporphyrinogen decarboxylase